MLINQSNTMLSDETFPSDLVYEEEDEEKETKEEEEFLLQQNGELDKVRFCLNAEISKSVDNFNSYITSMNFNNSADASSLSVEKLIKISDSYNMTESIQFDDFQQQPESCYSFKSVDVSSSCKTSRLPPPRAPIKKKKSFSCHDLQLKKSGSCGNYDHVESKVKKLIQNLAEDRRKTLLRHKSMPVCPQTAPIDEKSSDEEFDSNDLKRELRRKSIKIYELEEKCEIKDNQIYQLECERSMMRMKFDKLRMEIHELKEIEKQYRELKSLTSPNKTLKNAQIQTEYESGFDDLSSTSDIPSNTGFPVPNCRNVNRMLSTGAIRQLAFDSSINQARFNEVTNTSTDNLIPESDPMEDVNLTALDSVVLESTAIKKKKSKKPKLKRFFGFVPCISRK